MNGLHTSKDVASFAARLTLLSASRDRVVSTARQLEQVAALEHHMQFSALQGALLCFSSLSFVSFHPVR